MKQNRRPVVAETEMYQRKHEVCAVAPEAAHGRAASEGDLRHCVAPVSIHSHYTQKGIIRKAQQNLNPIGYKNLEKHLIFYPKGYKIKS